MLRVWLCSAAVLLAVPCPAFAHFVFVVPRAAGDTADVVMSENLEPDADVDIAIIRGAQLFARNRQNDDIELPLREGKVEHAFEIEIPAMNVELIHGDCSLGVMQRGDSKPFLLEYHPKTILPGAGQDRLTLGGKTPVEIVPGGKPGARQFQVLAAGKPAAGAEVHLILPDGSQEKVLTDEDGRTRAFDRPGRYGAWARHVEAQGGTHDGKPYDEIRHYATLVVDFEDVPAR